MLRCWDVGLWGCGDVGLLGYWVLGCWDDGLLGVGVLGCWDIGLLGVSVTVVSEACQVFHTGCD
jgi:hypothetical protein